MDDVPVTLLAAQLGLELIGRVYLGSGGGSGQRVAGLFLGLFAGLGVSSSACGLAGYSLVSDVGFGRSRHSLGLFPGFHRGVLALIQLSLSYLELLLRHLVSCFLIA